MNAPDRSQARLEEQAPPSAPGRLSAGDSRERYLAARREWNAQFGSLAASANNWRLVALISLFVALVATTGLVTVGARTKTVPFVSVLDTSGRIVQQGFAEGSTPNDTRVISAMIARFVTNLRAVSSDGTVQKKTVYELFAMLSTGDPAFRVVSDYMQGIGNPFEKAKTETVSVQIASILPMSESTYQAEWRETTRDRKGATLSTHTYQALVTLRQQTNAPSHPSLDNPLGLYVTDIHWTKKL